MSKPFVAALIVGLLAIFAFTVEAAQPKTRAIEHVSPEKFTNLYVEPIGTCSIDWAVLWNFGLGVACRESSACPAQGARIGDACLASTSMGSDGGSALSSQAQLTCRAATDAIYFKLCFQASDAGTLDLGEAWFSGRAIH